MVVFDLRERGTPALLNGRYLSLVEEEPGDNRNSLIQVVRSGD
jgi:hypothetical protein